MKGGCAMQSLFSFDSREASYKGNKNMVHFLHFLHLNCGLKTGYDNYIIKKYPTKICRLQTKIRSLQILKRSLQISVRRLYRNSPGLGLYIKSLHILRGQV